MRHSGLGKRKMLIIRDRAISIVVEYVPVSHVPDRLAENRKIIHNSGLEEGNLLAMWIKQLQ